MAIFYIKGLGRAKAPKGSTQSNLVYLQLLGEVVIHFGTNEQKIDFFSEIDHDVIWILVFGEPQGNSGSSHTTSALILSGDANRRILPFQQFGIDFPFENNWSFHG